MVERKKKSAKSRQIGCRLATSTATARRLEMETPLDYQAELKKASDGWSDDVDNKRNMLSDIVLTIDSDAEAASEVDSENESEVQNQLLDKRLENAKAEKGRSLNGDPANDKKSFEFSSNCHFEAEDLYDEEVHDDDGAVQESWDFTEAIKKIKDNQHPAQKVTTMLETKIKSTLEARALRQAKAELGLADNATPEIDVQGTADDETGGESESMEASESDRSSVFSGDSDIEDYAEEEIPSATQPEKPLDKNITKNADLAVEGKVDADWSRQLGPNSLILKTKKKAEIQQRTTSDEKIPSFAELNLSRPLLRAVQSLGFDSPTPIQAKSIPFSLSGRDICGSAVTGSGKTAAFVLPSLERLLYRPKRVKATRVLIITPTRELTQQCYSMITKLAKFTDISSCAIVGGLSASLQLQELRSRPDVVVATPGRLIDHLRNSLSVDLDNVEILILDEADRLLELGFIEAIKELLKCCPKNRQTMLFSATMTTSVSELVQLSMKNPVMVKADPLYDMASRLVQEFVRVRETREGDREAMIMSLCSRSFKKKVIVFFQKKSQAHRFCIIFGLCGLRAGELHGNLTQAQRLEALQRFRDGEIDYLLCTDLAARGLDISNVQVVLNFDMPKDLRIYVHRVGRTARAGRGGIAVTLASEKQRILAKEVLRRSRKNVNSRTIPDGVIEEWKAKIIDLESEIRDVLDQERVEKQLRLAEMEVNKANNMIEHRDEIMSRPRKDWFQSEKEKQATRSAQRSMFLSSEMSPRESEDGRSTEAFKINHHEGDSTTAEGDKHQLASKKRRRMEMNGADVNKVSQEKRRLDNDSTKGSSESRKRKKLMQTSNVSDKSSAKAAKRRARETKFEEMISVPAERNVKKTQSKQKQPKQDVVSNGEKASKRSSYVHSGDSGNSFARELLPGEGVSLLDQRSKKKYGKDGGLVFKEADLSKGGLRKGGKRGPSKFKSKAKHKRRK